MSSKSSITAKTLLLLVLLVNAMGGFLDLRIVVPVVIVIKEVNVRGRKDERKNRKGEKKAKEREEMGKRVRVEKIRIVREHGISDRCGLMAHLRTVVTRPPPPMLPCTWYVP